MEDTQHAFFSLEINSKANDGITHFYRVDIDK